MPLRWDNTRFTNNGIMVAGYEVLEINCINAMRLEMTMRMRMAMKMKVKKRIRKKMMRKVRVKRIMGFVMMSMDSTKMLTTIKIANTKKGIGLSPNGQSMHIPFQTQKTWHAKISQISIIHDARNSFSKNYSSISKHLKRKRDCQQYMG
ncbi:hypothetical protein RFI_22198 [Reticulomyxa filosa]|uniref:Uncharacterized protein n=1 Tax=Reticulomyxa filosa TaxID=46433 RepID=X6MNB6_RETFI|nr:hypothetical protein RFI_22198 [Reticulomyxa filosa]|eukprot:ETO15166.1 hypothetical protein RFI_22198 [Reticulomyxa filosa]